MVSSTLPKSSGSDSRLEGALGGTLGGTCAAGVDCDGDGPDNASVMSSLLTVLEELLPFFPPLPFPDTVLALACGTTTCGLRWAARDGDNSLVEIFLDENVEECLKRETCAVAARLTKCVAIFLSRVNTLGGGGKWPRGTLRNYLRGEDKRKT